MIPAPEPHCHSAGDKGLSFLPLADWPEGLLPSSLRWPSKWRASCFRTRHRCVLTLRTMGFIATWTAQSQLRGDLLKYYSSFMPIW